MWKNLLKWTLLAGAALCTGCASSPELRVELRASRGAIAQTDGGLTARRTERWDALGLVSLVFRDMTSRSAVQTSPTADLAHLFRALGPETTPGAVPRCVVAALCSWEQDALRSSLRAVRGEVR